MTSPLATEVLPSVRAEFRRNAALVIGISAATRAVPPLQKPQPTPSAWRTSRAPAARLWRDAAS